MIQICKTQIRKILNKKLINPKQKILILKINYLIIKRGINNINQSNLANLANNVKMQRMENVLLTTVSVKVLKFLKNPV